MYGYIYLTTNLINNKKYIGQHCSSFFDPKYHGSGKHLKSALKKYGASNFLTEVLCECLTKLELDEREIYYIELYDAVNSIDFYNISLGGGGVSAFTMPLQQRYNIGKGNKNKVRTPEMNLINSENHKGFRWMNNGIINKEVFKEDIDNYLSNNWQFGMIPGRKSSKRGKCENISLALKGMKKTLSHIEHHREALLKKHMHWYNNGETSRLIPESEEIPDGYKLGRLK